MKTETAGYDAVLLVSFGGPEGPDDVMPFLRNVVRGRQVPDDRLLDVARHYEHFGGVSPINQQNRDLVQALQTGLAAAGMDVPVYWGNRNWHPMLTDTVCRMRDDGVRRALAFVTSAYSSYSGCREYREDIERARAAAGDDAPPVDKIRAFYNHPLFIEVNAERVRQARNRLPSEVREAAPVAFTAHSIPLSMAAGCDYQQQLLETSRRVADAAAAPDWALVYQSRSGPPQHPWLEPDVLTHLQWLHDQGHRSVIVAPVGFVSDHVEVLYDLDYEARHRAEALGLAMVRAQTVGVHPDYVRMIVELVRERWDRSAPDDCTTSCCRGGTARPAPAVATGRVEGA